MVQNVDQRVVDTIRVLAADVVKGANSGHPGKNIKKTYTQIRKKN